MKKYIRKILFWINLFLAAVLVISYMAIFINPARVWQFAFFGLAYPVLLGFNIGFIVFWIWRKKMLALISVFVILAGWSIFGRYFQVRVFERSAKKEEGIKLLSYNVRVFNQYSMEQGNSVLDSVLCFITSQNADIVCFQEFFTVNDHEKSSEQYIDSMLNEFPDKHISYVYKPGITSNYGLATYSKYPIIRRGRVKFKNSNNSCLFSDLVIHNDTLRVYNTHLQSINLKKENYNFVDSLVFRFNSKRMDEVKDISGRLKNAFIKRAEQADILSRHIRQSSYSVIVCGDLNDTPVSYTYQKVRGELKDAFVGSGKGIGNTYRGNFPSFRIDYILHSKTIRSTDYRIHRINLSDHYPVSCNLSIRN